MDEGIALVRSWRRRYHRWSTTVYGPTADVTALSWLGEERVAIGCLPTARTLFQLPAHGVTHVVNCRSRAQTWFSQDLMLERELFGTDHVAHAPMWDSGRPQPPRLWATAVTFAAQALENDGTARVLIHCQQGRRRSVMVAYAVLRLRGHEPAAASALIKAHRWEARIVDAYTSSVERWLADRHGRAT